MIDLARELPKSSKYFYDFFHFTNDGARKAGDIIYSHLSQHLQIKYREYAHERTPTMTRVPGKRVKLGRWEINARNIADVSLPAKTDLARFQPLTTGLKLSRVGVEFALINAPDHFSAFGQISIRASQWFGKSSLWMLSIGVGGAMPRTC